MKLVMTLLVRDEADVLDAQLAFHLNQGFDLIIATDHGSTDGTADILAGYAHDGHVHVLEQRGAMFRQAEWVTHMARLAATRFGADWVVNSDADEFWWPRLGSFKEMLAWLPPRYGIVRGYERHFAPRPEEEGHFAERMIVRMTSHGQVPGDDGPFQGTIQMVHRADPTANVAPGNHDLVGTRLLKLRGWYPFEVLHFPLRTVEQSRRKFSHRLAALRLEPTIDAGGHTLSAGRAMEDDAYDDWYASYVVGEAEIAERTKAGLLTVDTRLRDALRQLAGVEELPLPQTIRYAAPGAGSSLVFSRPGLADEACYADEMQVFDEWDSQVRSMCRIRELGERVGELERARGALARLRALPSGRNVP